MLFIREFVVCKHERGLLFKNGDFLRFLAPAVYRFFDPGKRYEVERFDICEPTFEHRLLDFLVRWYPDEIDALFVRVETSATQVALIYRNGQPWTVVAPGRRALYWKGVVYLKVEIVDVEQDLAVAPLLTRALVDAAVRLRRKQLERFAKPDEPASMPLLIGADAATAQFAHVKL